MVEKPQSLVWAAVVRFMTVALFFDALAPLFPLMATSNGLSPAFFQILLGTCYLIFAFSQLTSVSIINMIGLYRSSATSCLYLGLATVALSLIQNPNVFIIIFLSMFVANSIGSNATRVILREATNESGYKRLIGWATSLVEIKQIAMPFIAGVVAAKYGWRFAVVLLVIPVVSAGIWLEFVDQKHRAQSYIKPTENKNSKKSGWLALMVMPTFYIPTLTLAAFQIAFSLLVVSLPFILFEEAKLPQAVIGLILSADNGFVAICLFLSGYLAPYCSSDRLLNIGIIIMAIGIIIIGLSFLLGIYYAIIGIIIFNGAFGFITVPCSGDILNISEPLRTKASSLLGFVQTISGGIFVGLFGLFKIPLIKGTIIVAIISITLIVTIKVISWRKC
ncbi:MFS transporter [Paenochrobactrum pullorum]|uniref:MFS transporter n=1 Tax=Paenochrobactrum pullorum TaxID=1324351 RepID=UPI0035BC00ED